MAGGDVEVDEPLLPNTHDRAHKLSFSLWCQRASEEVDIIMFKNMMKVLVWNLKKKYSWHGSRSCNNDDTSAYQPLKRIHSEEESLESLKRQRYEDGLSTSPLTEPTETTTTMAGDGTMPLIQDTDERRKRRCSWNGNNKTEAAISYRSLKRHCTWNGSYAKMT